ncbi:MAG: metallophosphoesterase family protein, partial [Candidatus Hodarchaeales archaeon]
MKKIAIFSDIHGNLEALKAVEKDIKSKNDLDLVVCLGDIVGYYPHPVECIKIVREMCDIVIQGNHDAAVVSPNFEEESKGFNETAKIPLIWTRNLLLKSCNIDNYNFLKDLSPQKTPYICKRKVL